MKIYFKRKTKNYVNAISALNKIIGKISIWSLKLSQIIVLNNRRKFMTKFISQRMWP